MGVFSLVILAANLLVAVSAQATTNATCLSSFNWMTNSKSQNPCQVAAYLEGVCSNGNWRIVALSNNTHYTGPDNTQINPCQCSTVAYSMISACGLCQNQTAESWSAWSYNCTTLYMGYTENIPAATAVPAWAYLDVMTVDQFNVTAAQAMASTNPPESTGAAKATASGSSTPSGAASPSHTSKSSNVGPIVGGVVGGVVGLGLVATVAAIFLIRRRRRLHTAPSAAYGGFIHGHIQPFHSPPMYQPSVGVRAPTKYYDPADPSTYPTTPPPLTIHTSSSGTMAHSQPRLELGRHYNFMPEL